MPGKSGSEFLAANDTRHSVGSMIISFEAGVFAGCECSTCTLGGVEPPKMYTSRRCWFQPAKTPADGPSSRREARQAGASSTRLMTRLLTHAFAGCVLHMYRS